MPELPEVETLCRQLKLVVVAEKILNVEVLDTKLGNPPDLSGRTVKTVHRRGKSLEIVLDSGMVLRLHLRMSGKLLWQTPHRLPLPHSRLVIGFEEGFLVLTDPRRFATLSVYSGTDGEGLPPFPFCAKDLPEIRACAARRRIAVKVFLMDQSVIAGIGNIYACEILHRAAIAPSACTCDISDAQWLRIANAASVILKRAIRARGTTVSDWRDLFGLKGEYQNQLEVYAREGLPCNRCGATVLRETLSGRGTYYCPSCQK